MDPGISSASLATLQQNFRSPKSPEELEDMILEYFMKLSQLLSQSMIINKQTELKVSTLENALKDEKVL